VHDGGVEIPSLGKRGAGWVALQIVALASIAIAGLAGPAWPADASPAVRAIGALLAIAGAALAALGIRALGPALTALPHPIDGAELRHHGVYARARHPIHGALLLVGAGWCLLSSWWAAIPWVCLVAILLAKSEREEGWLSERYADYPAYRAAVRRRFVPFVF
jgi:protein-S-isoprenylcysteine O-methyltransferase Ste14